MPLFRKIDEFEGYFPMNVGSDFAPLSPYLISAERDFIVPVIGKNQFEDLNDDYNAAYDLDPDDLGANMDPDLLILLIEVRRTLAQYTAWLMIDKKAVTVGTNGIRVTMSEHEKPASETKIAKLKLNTLQLSYSTLENLMEFLDENIALYGVYAASEEYKKFKRLFVNTAVKFSEFFNINNSRFTFFRISSIMNRIENGPIKATISKEYFDELKAELEAGSVSANNQKVVDLIQPAVCNLTMGDAVTQLSLQMGPLGITVIDQASVKELPNRNAPANPNYMDKLERRAAQDGKNDLDAVKLFLDNNIADYGTYAGSDVYVAPGDEPDPIIEQGDGGFLS